MTGGLFPGGELSDVPWWQLLILFCIAHAIYDLVKHRALRRYYRVKSKRNFRRKMEERASMESQVKLDHSSGGQMLRVDGANVAWATNEYPGEGKGELKGNPPLDPNPCR